MWMLYLIGVKKKSKVDITDIWTSELGLTVFRVTMGERRFGFLISTMPFDDKSSKLSRVRSNNLAAISEKWNEFVQNFDEYYSPSANFTIDGQLLSFKGNCRFKVGNTTYTYEDEACTLWDETLHVLYVWRQTLHRVIWRRKRKTWRRNKKEEEAKK